VKLLSVIRMTLTLMVVLARLLFQSRLELVLENLALRQQLAVFKQKRARPRLRPADRCFWVLLGRAWRRWASVLLVVQPDTVVGWQRQGFRWFWRLKSKAKQVGRPQVSTEIRELIERMARDNGW
jgi:putative transposase